MAATSAASACDAIPVPPAALGHIMERSGIVGLWRARNTSASGVRQDELGGERRRRVRAVEARAGEGGVRAILLQRGADAALR